MNDLSRRDNMNTKRALWMADEGLNPSANQNNLIDLLMDNVDLFELFPELESDEDVEPPGDEPACAQEERCVAGLPERGKTGQVISPVMHSGHLV
jgi:hypothetical protein